MHAYTQSNNLSAMGNSMYNEAAQNYMQDMLLWNTIYDYVFDAEIAEMKGETAESEMIYEKIDTLIIYRWNRVYPYDRKLDIDMGRFERTGRIEFAGYSHDCVTKDTFRRLPTGERREYGDEE